LGGACLKWGAEIIKAKNNKITGRLRKLHREELHILNSSENYIRVIKSKNMGWAGHIADIGRMRNTYKCLFVKFRKGRSTWEPWVFIGV
jgi:hypothetical protein